MGSVIHAYHPKEEIPDNEAEIKEMYRRVLNGKRALLLFDNALDDKQVLKLIPPKSCGLLVTSRKTIKLPGLFRKDLYVLKPEEALELLLKVWCSTSGSAEPPKVDPAWSEIARLCGFLPLALRAAASLLANTPDLSPANYAEELKDERTRLERIGMEGVELSVDASFNLSFQRLATEIQHTFLNASVFPADFDGQAEEHICQDEGHKHLSELVRWSLVEYQRPSQEGEGRYHLHDLVRLFAARRLEEAGGEADRYDAQQHHAEYFRDVLSSATELYIKGDALSGLRRFDLERTNIESAWVWAKKNLASNNTAASICNAFLNWPYLLELRMHYRELISWMETALAGARQLKDKSMEGVHLGNMGNAYANLGDARKAIEHYEQALAISCEIGNRRDEGGALGNMGCAYYILGDARKAIEYHEQHLTIAREMGDRRGEGSALSNMGLAYYSLGDACKAIEYHEQALVIICEIGDRWAEGKALGNIGLAYVNLGETHKAIDYYEQALAIACEIGNRGGEGNALGNLGNGYADLGEMHKAIEYHEQALVIICEIGNRCAEGNVLGNMGLAYVALGDARKAIDYYEKQLRITKEIGDRRGEGNALRNISLALDHLGKRAEAIKCAKAALKIQEKIEDPRAENVRRKLQEWEGQK
ncbi:MAG: tetratricopeptide repeat protein [Methanothrix sp.]|nr:tetratricopeptide repeat protein [Methanothrix sp.]